MKKILIFIFLLIIISVVAFINYTKLLSKRAFPQNIATTPKQMADQFKNSPALSTLATNLNVPWSISFLPDGNLLLTERPGTVRLVSASGDASKPIANIKVNSVGEGGLLGSALSPNFKDNNNVFLYYTYGQSGNVTLNRVVKYKFEDNNLIQEEIIVDKIPGASNHDGGRIKFGPDGFLYITAGDGEEPSRAQNRDSLAGKILRVTENGDPAPNNPFGTKIYSYGHRNPQLN